jgi:hypothetical protein
LHTCAWRGNAEGSGARQSQTAAATKKKRADPSTLSPHPSQPSSLAAVRSPASDADLEATFGFQLEAVTKQLRDELELIPKMKAWAPWDVPEGETRELRIERPVPPPEPKK